MNSSGRSSPVSIPSVNESVTSHDTTASLTCIEMFRFTHKWNIPDFSTQQELCAPTEFIESISFPTTDNDRHRFCMKLFPNGKDEECIGFLSLFLLIQRCPGPRLRFRVNFYIETTEGQRGCALNRNIVSINKGGIITASKFLSAETLKLRANRMVPGDILTVCVDLTVYSDPSSICMPMTPPALTTKDYQSQLDTLFISEVPRENTLLHDFSEMYKRMPAPDLNLRIGSSILQCHRVVVMTRSPYFDRMFSGQLYKESNEHEVELKDFNEIGMRAAIQYMYTDNVDDITSCAQDTLIVAGMLFLDELKAKCEQALILTQYITGSLDDICRLLVVGDTYAALELRKHCVQILNKNYSTIMTSQSWKEMQMLHPDLSSEILNEVITRLSNDDTLNVPTNSLSPSSTNEEPSAKRAK